MRVACPAHLIILILSDEEKIYEAPQYVIFSNLPLFLIDLRNVYRLYKKKISRFPFARPRRRYATHVGKMCLVPSICRFGNFNYVFILFGWIIQ
jgi:hypothetical protein